jgi:hypothetical protein
MKICINIVFTYRFSIGSKLKFLKVIGDISTFDRGLRDCVIRVGPFHVDDVPSFSVRIVLVLGELVKVDGEGFVGGRSVNPVSSGKDGDAALVAQAVVERKGHLAFAG